MGLGDDLHPETRQGFHAGTVGGACVCVRACVRGGADGRYTTLALRGGASAPMGVVDVSSGRSHHCTIHRFFSLLFIFCVQVRKGRVCEEEIGRVRGEGRGLGLPGFGP